MYFHIDRSIAVQVVFLEQLKSSIKHQELVQRFAFDIFQFEVSEVSCGLIMLG